MNQEETLTKTQKLAHLLSQKCMSDDSQCKFFNFPCSSQSNQNKQILINSDKKLNEKQYVLGENKSLLGSKLKKESHQLKPIQIDKTQKAKQQKTVCRQIKLLLTTRNSFAKDQHENSFLNQKLDKSSYDKVKDNQFYQKINDITYSSIRNKIIPISHYSNSCTNQANNSFTICKSNQKSQFNNKFQRQRQITHNQNNKIQEQRIKSFTFHALNPLGIDRSKYDPKNLKIGGQKLNNQIVKNKTPHINFILGPSKKNCFIESQNRILGGCNNDRNINKLKKDKQHWKQAHNLSSQIQRQRIPIYKQENNIFREQVRVVESNYLISQDNINSLQNIYTHKKWQINNNSKDINDMSNQDTLLYKQQFSTIYAINQDKSSYNQTSFFDKSLFNSNQLKLQSTKQHQLAGSSFSTYSDRYRQYMANQSVLSTTNHIQTIFQAINIQSRSFYDECMSISDNQTKSVHVHNQKQQTNPSIIQRSQKIFHDKYKFNRLYIDFTQKDNQGQFLRKQVEIYSKQQTKNENRLQKILDQIKEKDQILQIPLSIAQKLKYHSKNPSYTSSFVVGSQKRQQQFENVRNIYREDEMNKQLNSADNQDDQVIFPTFQKQKDQLVSQIQPLFETYNYLIKQQKELMRCLEYLEHKSSIYIINGKNYDNICQADSSWERQHSRDKCNRQKLLAQKIKQLQTLKSKSCQRQQQIQILRQIIRIKRLYKQYLRQKPHNKSEINIENQLICV